MADIAKVKRNIKRMIDQGAPESDIDAYVASEGTTPEELRGQQAAPHGGFEQFQSMMNNGQIAKPASRYPDLVAGKLTEGVIGLAELPGAARDLVQKGSVWAAGKMGASPEAQSSMTQANEAMKLMPYPFGGIMSGAPGPGTIQPQVEKFTGPFPVPQGNMEEIVGRAAMMAPGMAMGPGGLLPKAGAWVGATLGGHGGRKLAESTGYEKLAPYADFAGTLLGGAAGLKGAEALGASSATKAAIAKVPVTAQIEETAKQLFKQADDIGLAVKPDAYSDMIDDVYRAAGDDGFFAANHPKLANAFAELERWRGSPMTLDQLKQIRRNLRTAYDPSNPSQNDAMHTAIAKFDDYMENFRPDQVLSGDTRAATILLKEANPTWAKFRKAELFDNIHENALNKLGANYTEAGYQTAVRQQLATIAKDNFKRFRYLKPNERGLILETIRSGRFMRNLGKFSLLSTGGPMRTAGAGLLASLFSPQVGAVVGGTLGAAGTIARPISTAMNRNNYNLLNATIRNGGPLAPNAAPSLLGSQIPIQGLLALPQVRGANH